MALGDAIREQEGVEAAVRFLWDAGFPGFGRFTEDGTVGCDGEEVTPRLEAEFLEWERQQKATDDLADALEEMVPSGFVFIDGRWQDPKDLALIEVFRDGRLVKRRLEDLLPYDELVKL